MTESVWFIQALGFLGLAAMVISFQMKNAKGVLLFLLLSDALFGFQYLLLGSVAGMIVLAVSIFRNIIMLLRDRWPVLGWKGWVVIMIIAEVALCAGNIAHWYDVLPIVGFAAATISFWSKDPQKLRFVNTVLISPVFFIFNLLVGSWGGVINEIITWTSSVTAYIRYRKKSADEGETETSTK